MKLVRIFGAILLAMALTACGSEQPGDVDHSTQILSTEPTQVTTVEATAPTEPSVHIHVFSAATCTDSEICQCGEVGAEALGHSWKDAICTASATCTRCNAVTGEPLGHNWKDATCTATATCTRCNAATGEPLGHNWIDPTCTEASTCARCGIAGVDALGHSYVAEQTPPTCTEAGYTTYRCGCGETYVADYVDGGHAYQNYVCTVCEQIDPEHTYQYWVEYGGNYYSALSQAVEDITGVTLGEHADAERQNAVAVAFVMDEKPYVVLLQDGVGSITLSGEMTLDLNGHTLTAEGESAIVVEDGCIVIDGRIAGSAVCVKDADSASAVLQNGGQLSILGGAYIMENGNKSVAIKVAGGTLDIRNACVTAAGTGTSYGIAVQEGAMVKGEDLAISTAGTGTTYGIYAAGAFDIRQAEVTATSTGAKSRALYVTATGNGSVSGCSFYGLCALYQATSVSSSQGINNAGTLTVYDCYAWGSHSGVTNSGWLNVCGGTYESPGHGGFYFGNISAPAYVCDAVIRVAAAPENSTSAADYNDCGFYIGGGSDRNNVVVYMDNCQIYADTWAFCLRDSSGEHDNTLYISNSTLTGRGFVRVDNTTHKLYIGAGNNFSADGVADKNGAPTAEAVIQTDESYRISA